jgi:hypothetical protein
MISNLPGFDGGTYKSDPKTNRADPKANLVLWRSAGPFRASTSCWSLDQTTFLTYIYDNSRRRQYSTESQMSLGPRLPDSLRHHDYWSNVICRHENLDCHHLWHHMHCTVDGETPVRLAVLSPTLTILVTSNGTAAPGRVDPSLRRCYLVYNLSFPLFQKDSHNLRRRCALL